MIKFILIAGSLVNINNITTLTTQGKNQCEVTVSQASPSAHSGVWSALDQNSCEEVLKEIGLQ